MKKTNGKSSILSGTIIAGALLSFTTSNTQAEPVNSNLLGESFEVRSELLSCNRSSSHNNVVEMKCGESANGKQQGKKEGKKKTENKTMEQKCGKEHKEKTAKQQKAKTKDEKKSKTSEGKCGEGKCGSK